MRCIYLAYPVTNSTSAYEVLRAAVKRAAPDVRCIEPEGRLLPEVIAEEAFAGIKACNILVADVTEYSIGVGVEIGYAFALGKQILLVAKEASKGDVSPFLRGIVNDIVFYRHDGDLPQQLAVALKRSNAAGPWTSDDCDKLCASSGEEAH